MTLHEYISLIGDRQASKQFGISERAAKSYRLGVRLPRPETARKIVRRANGKITLADIYGNG